MDQITDQSLYKNGDIKNLEFIMSYLVLIMVCYEKQVFVKVQLFKILAKRSRGFINFRGGFKEKISVQLLNEGESKGGVEVKHETRFISRNVKL